MAMGLEALEQPIFGRAKAEWSVSPNSAPPPRAHLFHTYLSSSNIRIHATDFHVNTFEAVLSTENLEDLRDMIGIGGSWSDFIDYVVSSLKSDDVKLILEGQPSRDGAKRAKIVAQRSKGMPLISIPLVKLVDGSAMDAMANLSLELYKEFRSTNKNLPVNNIVNKIVPNKSENIEAIPKLGDNLKNSDSPEKSGAQFPGSSKVVKRVVPAYHRAKKRGAHIQDTEDGEDD